jgi:ATP-dependent DNA helicase RecG
MSRAMDIEWIKSLVAQKESHTLEFKKSTTQLKAAFETLCAFLNEQGGTVLIGVTDSGKIAGQDVTDNTRQEIARELNKIEPPAQITVDYVLTDNGKRVIVLQATAGSYVPHVYDGRPFQRNQSTTIKMAQHRYEQLLVKRGQLNYAWDELPAADYGIDSLDHEEIRRTIRQGIEANRISEKALTEEITDILKRLRLLRNGRLTNAAVVLFAKDVQPNYPQCHVKMARFKGTSKTGEFIDNQSLYGNAFLILSEASAFIKRHLSIASFYQEDRLERIDKPALPTLAIREGLINAICHRDYANRSSSISIAIYDDRLEIWNYGLLPSELTIKDLKGKHESHPRNKLIAEIFYNRGLIEKWGTGTTKMIDICKADDIPAPEFEEYSGGLSVTFAMEPARATTKVEEAFGPLTAIQQEIIEILTTQGSLSPSHIITKLKAPIPERTLRYHLLTLKKLGIVGTHGHTKATRWFIIDLEKK